MKIAFITRSTLHEVPGGDTIQVLQTAKYLRKSGARVNIFSTTDRIDYNAFDLLYFSNITRPSDILYHICKTDKPFVVSPILVDYSEYDKQHRKGLSGFILNQLPASSHEYIKTLSRWIGRKDCLQSKEYIWKGQQKSIRQILEKAAGIFPNSVTEYKKLKELYPNEKNYSIVPNGVDPCLFEANKNITKNTSLVLCAARIEGLKNQLNLIKALNNTCYTLMLVGSAAPNQKKYYAACRSIAAKNILFYDHVPQETLIHYYQVAKVHALPSWFETCGLSSLEAAAMGCNLVISDKGYTREYFGDDAFYCDPGDVQSIFNAVERAAQASFREPLQKKILQNYTWQHAAAITLEACKNIISA